MLGFPRTHVHPDACKIDDELVELFNTAAMCIYNKSNAGFLPTAF